MRRSVELRGVGGSEPYARDVVRRYLPVEGIAASIALFVAVAAADVAAKTDASPIRPPGFWHWAWLLGVAGAFVAYVLGVLRVRRRRPALAPVLIVAVILQLAPLSGPLLLSSDVYGYWIHGRIAAVYHQNPYAETPAAVLEPGQPGYNSGLDTTLYGPGFTAASEIHARVVGTSLRAVEVTYRIAAAVGVLLLLLMIALVVRRPAFAVAFIGWNPLLALHFAGGGHNDIWMLVFVVGGLLLARRGKPALAGVGWAASAFVKSSSLALLPLEALAALRRDTSIGARFVRSFLVAAVAFSALATARYGTAWPLFVRHASSALSQTSSLSLVFRLGQLGVPRQAAKAVLGGVFVVGYILLLREAWRGRARLSLAATLLIFTPAWLMPWYGSWPVVLAAIEDDVAAQIVAVIATAYLLSDAIPLPFS